MHPIFIFFHIYFPYISFIVFFVYLLFLIFFFTKTSLSYIYLYFYIHILFPCTVFGNKNWRDIDRSIDFSLIPDSDLNVDLAQFYRSNNSAVWPSSIVIRDSVEGYVKFIWDKFLCDSSPTQICMSGVVLQNTIKRLKLLHIYGKEAFSETLLGMYANICIKYASMHM